MVLFWSSVKSAWRRARNGSLAPRNRIQKGCRLQVVQQDYLISTKRGLYGLGPRGLVWLLAGQFYGLSRHGDRWYAFRKIAPGAGQLLSFAFDGQKASQTCLLLEGLSEGCHQIDFLGETLLVADTYHNRLLRFEFEGERLRPTGTFYPPGPLDEGRESPNYAHLNSLWHGDGTLCVLFHNETSKTGRHSEIVTLDDEFRIVRRQVTPAGNAHNILRYRGKPLYCDSTAGTLCWDGQIVHRTHQFTRGLSITADYIAVGRAEYGKRQCREKLHGGVDILDHRFQLVESLDLPGMVQEIRAWGCPDYGLSNCCRDGSYPFRALPDAA